MKRILLLITILFSTTTFGFEVLIQLKMTKGGKQIFTMDNNTRIEKGDILNLYDGEKDLGEIEIIKVSKTGDKILTKAVEGSFNLIEGENYRLIKNDTPQISTTMTTKHFGHVFLMDNTNRSFGYYVEEDGVTGSGRLNTDFSGLGLGYEHMFNMFDDLFHIGGGLSYEFGRAINHKTVIYSNGGSIGGSETREIKSIFTVFANVSLNLQEAFDLYFGINYSSMALTDVTHPSFGYQAGIAAMKNHVRLGLIYRINTYAGDITDGKEKIITNDFIGTVGYVF